MDNDISIEISETNRGNEQIIINRKYKFNFSSKRKDNSKIYKCTEYKTSNRCESFIILNNKNEILKYKNTHNHPGKKVEVMISMTKHKINEEIRKSSIPFDIKPKRIYDKVSQELGFECPDYKKIKSQINRNINKCLPQDIKTFDEIPTESEYYKNKRNENFMIFKNRNMIIFQSPFQAKLFSKYCDDIFADGTFYVAPNFSYQVFITRIYIKEFDTFYTTSFSILKNKGQKTYEMVLEKIKNNALKYSENIAIIPKNFHCDLEKSISNAAEKIFPNINIKYCIWHFKRALRFQKNKLCYTEVENCKDLYLYYKSISNFPFINPTYINDIFNEIESECQKHNYVQFQKFLDYFKKTYLINYEIKRWNYYDNIEHITNNASESYNRRLNDLFEKKPTFYKLILKFQNEESLSYYDYEKRNRGIIEKKKKKLKRTDEINAFVNYYKKMESLLKNQKSDKDDFVKLWLKCLNDLNIKIINL